MSALDRDGRAVLSLSFTGQSEGRPAASYAAPAPRNSGQPRLSSSVVHSTDAPAGGDGAGELQTALPTRRGVVTVRCRRDASSNPGASTTGLQGTSDVVHRIVDTRRLSDAQASELLERTQGTLMSVAEVTGPRTNLESVRSYPEALREALRRAVASHHGSAALDVDSASSATAGGGATQQQGARVAEIADVFLSHLPAAVSVPTCAQRRCLVPPPPSGTDDPASSCRSHGSTTHESSPDAPNSSRLETQEFDDDRDSDADEFDGRRRATTDDSLAEQQQSCSAVLVLTSPYRPNGNAADFVAQFHDNAPSPQHRHRLLAPVTATTAEASRSASAAVPASQASRTSDPDAAARVQRLEQFVAVLCAKVLAALSVAHARGVVHGNVTATNIFVTRHVTTATIGGDKTAFVRAHPELTSAATAGVSPPDSSTGCDVWPVEVALHDTATFRLVLRDRSGGLTPDVSPYVLRAAPQPRVMRELRGDDAFATPDTAQGARVCEERQRAIEHAHAMVAGTAGLEVDDSPDQAQQQSPSDPAPIGAAARPHTPAPADAVVSILGVGPPSADALCVEPEAEAPLELADATGDVWAVGQLAVELLTGMPVLPSESRDAAVVGLPPVGGMPFSKEARHFVTTACSGGATPATCDMLLVHPFIRRNVALFAKACMATSGTSNAPTAGGAMAGSQQQQQQQLTVAAVAALLAPSTASGAGGSVSSPYDAPLDAPVHTRQLSQHAHRRTPTSGVLAAVRSPTAANRAASMPGTGAGGMLSAAMMGGSVGAAFDQRVCLQRLVSQPQTPAASSAGGAAVPSRQQQQQRGSSLSPAGGRPSGGLAIAPFDAVSTPSSTGVSPGGGARRTTFADPNAGLAHDHASTPQGAESMGAAAVVVPALHAILEGRDTLATHAIDARNNAAAAVLDGGGSGRSSGVSPTVPLASSASVPPAISKAGQQALQSLCDAFLEADAAMPGFSEQLLVSLFYGAAEMSRAVSEPAAATSTGDGGASPSSGGSGGIGKSSLAAMAHAFATSTNTSSGMAGVGQQQQLRAVVRRIGMLAATAAPQLRTSGAIPVLDPAALAAPDGAHQAAAGQRRTGPAATTFAHEPPPPEECAAVDLANFLYAKWLTGATSNEAATVLRIVEATAGVGGLYYNTSGGGAGGSATDPSTAAAMGGGGGMFGMGSSMLMGSSSGGFFAAASPPRGSSLSQSVSHSRVNSFRIPEQVPFGSPNLQSVAVAPAHMPPSM